MPGAWKSVLSGEAAAYRAEIMQRQDKIVAARTKDEIVEAIQPLNTQPSLLPLDELIYQRRGKIPRYMQVLVKAQDLVREYGRGNVPEEAWQELKRSCGIE